MKSIYIPVSRKALASITFASAEIKLYATVSALGDVHQPNVLILDRLHFTTFMALVTETEILADQFYFAKIIVFGNCSATERITLLEKGASDVFSEPINHLEIKMRIESLLHTYKLFPRNIVKLHPFLLYPNSGKVQIGSDTLALTQREISILTCLLVHRGQVITRQQMLDWLDYHATQTVSDASLDVYIKRLRDRLNQYHSVVETVRGFGYRFNEVSARGYLSHSKSANKAH